MYLVSGQQTLPTENRDYCEWHQHRQHYALWYLEIDQPELIEYLDQIKLQFQDELYAPNLRQYHITLFICGFLTEQKQLDDDFLKSELQAQLTLLFKENLKQFRLKTGAVNSFESALFVEVEDGTNCLNQIRAVFQRYNVEIAALEYCPHITLGLYRKVIASDFILHKIQSLSQCSFELNVERLTFGYFQAHELQGRLFPLQQFNLEKS